MLYRCTYAMTYADPNDAVCDYDNRKEKYLNKEEEIFNDKDIFEYHDKYVVPTNMQLDVTHRCSLCPEMC